MTNAQPDRKLLEELWRDRLNEARLRVELARNFLREIQQDFKNGTMPQPDGDFAFQRAGRAENSALAEYSRVLRVFHDLTVKGKIPDETDWPPRYRAARGSDGDAA